MTTQPPSPETSPSSELRQHSAASAWRHAKSEVVDADELF